MNFDFFPREVVYNRMGNMTATSQPIPAAAEPRAYEPEIAVPVVFRAKYDETLSFDASAVGLTDDGFGFRSKSLVLAQARIESIIPQPFLCRAVAPDAGFTEVLCVILRLEACRYDPEYLFFGVAEFLRTTDVHRLAESTGLKLYPRKKPSRPVISRPPPPPPLRK